VWNIADSAAKSCVNIVGFFRYSLWMGSFLLPIHGARKSLLNVNRYLEPLEHDDGLLKLRQT
jgi:hypothetical protein